jgi:hypothetical protein
MSELIAISTSGNGIVISQDGRMIFEGRLIDLTHRFNNNTESIIIQAEKRHPVTTPQPTGGSIKAMP